MGRLPGPGRHLRAPQLRRRRGGRLPGRRGAGQDRRSSGATAAALHDVHPTPRPRERCPGPRSQAAAICRPRSTASRCTRAGLDRRAARASRSRSSRRCWPSPSARGVGLSAGPRPRPSRTSWAPSSRSTRARSSSSSRRSRRAGVGLIGTDAGRRPHRCGRAGSIVSTGSARARRATSARAGCARRCCSAAALVIAGRRARARPRTCCAPRPFDRRTRASTLRGTQPAPDDIVLVAIDDQRSISRRGRPGRSTATGHAKVIAQPGEGGREGDRLRRPVHRAEPRRKADQAWSTPPAPPGPRRGRARPSRTTGQTQHLRRPAGLLTCSARRASVLRSPTPTAAIRRMRFQTNEPRSFDMAAASRSPATDPPPSGNRPGSTTPGPPFTVPSSASSTSRTASFTRAAVRGKIVVVGASAPVAAGPPPTSTTGTGLMPGPRSSVAAWTALEGFPLRSARRWVDSLLSCCSAR